MKKLPNGDIEFSRDEFAAMLGGDSWICPDCGRLHPDPEWAKRGNICTTCKDRPSQEDLEGKSNETTPADWQPPRKGS